METWTGLKGGRASDNEPSRRRNATGTATVSRSISGTGCWLTTLTMTVRGSSWIGSYSRPVVSAGVSAPSNSDEHSHP
ncbi:hypothetical protein AVEN_245470-1 [Araneus ventricosus]|uniref:Uncharacterized protein n=1 Tax=Araneus ventricosus TaxID=182803 RepID=A0A4Y2D7K7_ARAVE|nr:hypothetical protein AVEN_245470-1 [Araneus ventricosus]